MRTLKTITFLLIFCSAFGQSKTYYNITKPNGDTAFWYKYQTTIAKKLSLPLLDTSSHSEYIRIWTNKQAIDIWQNQNGSFSGMLTTWTDEYVPSNEEQTNRKFIRTKVLDSDTVKLLTQLLTFTNILDLPTDDSISGWQHGFDGITYLIEYSTKNRYSFKSYWTPKAQDSLSEARQVQSFIDNALGLTDAQNVWKEFSKNIPFESYYNGGPGTAIRVLSSKERKKYFKERKNYRQQQLGKSRAEEHKIN